MAEREILFDAILVRRMNCGCTGQPASAFRIFRLQQMAFAGAWAQHFAGGGNLKTFGHGFLRFDAFGTSHKSLSKKERAIYGAGTPEARVILAIWRVARATAENAKKRQKHRIEKLLNHNRVRPLSQSLTAYC